MKTYMCAILLLSSISSYAEPVKIEEFYGTYLNIDAGAPNCPTKLIAKEDLNSSIVLYTEIGDTYLNVTEINEGKKCERFTGRFFAQLFSTTLMDTRGGQYCSESTLDDNQLVIKSRKCLGLAVSCSLRETPSISLTLNSSFLTIKSEIKSIVTGYNCVYKKSYL